ncbi:olfactory receptor 6B1-like [Spea bombifrons]|uniref:olfactory receptor 6B1-like n=1 Tax=Spea bombifrons TaxID=233779 RepID=UPI00234B3320|nr:olfactory receptor 6B1-like [Spea bombifrons]
MGLGNESVVTIFVILGFPGSPSLQYLLFFLLCITYIITLLSNIVIIAIICKERCLHTPMYFYLRIFSLLEVCYVSVIVPKILTTITQHGRLIPYSSCITQLFFFFFLSSTECFLLSVMAFDRYLAICHPLRYPSLMDMDMCWNLTICSWFGGFITTFPPILLISRLPFCESNLIDHFFCDAPPLLKLSCADTNLNDLLDFICASVVIVTSLIVTLISYLYILRTVLKMPTAKGRTKTFSTCGSHLIVVIIYYGAVIFMYVRPKVGFTFSLNRIVAVFYTVITPILNPIIYCLRNRNVKSAFRKHLAEKRFSGVRG